MVVISQQRHYEASGPTLYPLVIWQRNHRAPDLKLYHGGHSTTKASKSIRQHINIVVVISQQRRHRSSDQSDQYYSLGHQNLYYTMVAILEKGTVEHLTSYDTVPMLATTQQRHHRAPDHFYTMVVSSEQKHHEAPEHILYHGEHFTTETPWSTRTYIIPW